MEAEREQDEAIKLPEGLDEQGFVQMLLDIVDCVDREKLYKNERFVRVRHPLLVERMGRDVVINVEVFNMVGQLMDELYKPGVTNSTIRLGGNTPEDTYEYLKDFLRLVQGVVKDADFWEGKVVELKAVMDKIRELNPDAKLFDVLAWFDSLLRPNFKMPTLVQDVMLYPNVTMQGHDYCPEQLFAGVEGLKNEVLGMFGLGEAGDDDERQAEVRAKVEAEAQAVRDWYTIHLGENSAIAGEES
jgi:hypothetical protein